MAKIKAGDVRVNIQEEDILWTDRKRKTIFALPWSFTKYTLTKTRLFIQTGFFTRSENEIRLYRISDITYTQTLGERMGKTGTLCVKSSDPTTPEVHLMHIKKAKLVKDILSACVDQARKDNGVRTSELVNGGGHPGHQGHDEPFEGGHLPDGMFMDANHDGIPDDIQN